jgi:hypothetical protein
MQLADLVDCSALALQAACASASSGSVGGGTVGPVNRSTTLAIAAFNRLARQRASPRGRDSICCCEALGLILATKRAERGKQSEPDSSPDLTPTGPGSACPVGVQSIVAVLGRRSAVLDRRATPKVKVDQYGRARSAWRLLVDRARKHSPPFTYQELCKELGVRPIIGQ